MAAYAVTKYARDFGGLGDVESGKFTLPGTQTGAIITTNFKYIDAAFFTPCNGTAASTTTLPVLQLVSANALNTTSVGTAFGVYTTSGTSITVDRSGTINDNLTYYYTIFGRRA